MRPNRRLITKLGKAFSDNVFYSRRKTALLPKTALRGWGARITLLYLLLITLFFLLGIRLFHLTIVQGAQNRELSEFNRIKTSIIHAPRGIFYDRRGQPLVENIKGFRVTGPCETERACKTQFMTKEEMDKKDVDANSVYLEPDYLRHYLYPHQTAHVLGHLGELSSEELGSPYYAYQDYILGDKLGTTGLEAVYEKALRGVSGKELIEVDSSHKKKRSLGKVDPQPGQNMTLSIDLDLQKVTYDAMGENPGAVVVTKPRTGEVLALVSTPGYDANLFHQGMSQNEYEELTSANDQPLFNKAISGAYPPGSTFKLVAAIAALETGKVKKSDIIEDTGVLRVGDFTFGNWYFSQYGKTEGPVDLYRGIARSNDIYFYKLGEAVGVDALAYWGKKMGIGAKTGIDLPGEAEGVMPDPIWRKKVRGEAWYLGDTYHLVIGQDDLVVTPLQVNMWTNAIASGGVLCQPTLLKDSNSNKKNSRCKDLQTKKENIETITEGMRRACSKGDDVGYQGTGWPLFDFTVSRETLTESAGSGEKKAVPVACKTGTSETGHPDGKTHAWFTAFAPLTNQPAELHGVKTISGEPEIVVTVLVEKGGEGSSVAGPIAKKILEEWFKR